MALTNGKMTETAFIIFTLDHQPYALPVDCVKTVIRAVQLTELPDAPELMTGILNMGGAFIPVMNIRKQFGLPEKPTDIRDRIIIADISGYTIAFMADAVKTVAVLETRPVSRAANIYPGMEQFLSGVSACNGVTVLIYDAASLFSETMLQRAAEAVEEIDASL